MPQVSIEEKARLLEKIRVLNCLYQVSELVVDGTHAFEPTLQAIVDLMPQAFEYPDKVAVAVRMDDNRYHTAGFRLSDKTASKAIVIDGDIRGHLEIVCLDEGDAARNSEAYCTFEENRLMEAVAKKIAYMIERKEAFDRKRHLEKQLRHADRLSTIGQLAAGIAHELNNPLGDILGFAQLASNSPDLNDDVYHDLVKIVKSTLYAREIIKKVLYFSRQTHPREAQTDLNHMINEWMDFFESRCNQSGIEIAVEMDDSLPVVTGDPAQLNQVLINVVVNAIQAMPAGGVLTIKTTRNQDRVSLIVQDTGEGIGEEEQEKIFLPFFTTKEVDQGTGLGLSVVYGIVNEHGGRIEVYSQVGEGSTFKIELPI
jgi:signal transduction histidine kinase